MYKVEIASRRVERQLHKVPNHLYPKVAAAIKSLENNPRPIGVTKLGGKVHRIRVGPYRIIYSIHDSKKVVVIDKVDRRKERPTRDTELLGLFRNSCVHANF